MEHGLILLIEAILAIDRNLQKPLRAVVPDLPRLRAQPNAVLADSEIVFGPRKAYAAAAVLGTLVGIVVLIGFGLAAFDRPRNQPVEAWYYISAGIAVLVSGAATAALVVHWSRGGAAILRTEGVEFIYRGRSIFCPWSLFQAVGTPYQPDHKRVILPVNGGTPVAVTDYEGNVTAAPAAAITTKPIAGLDDGQVALANLYEVKLVELCELLLHLGRRLGGGPAVLSNGDALEPASAALATAQANGWIRVRLTRLPFPPVCLGCGQVTRDSISHTLDQVHAVHIDLPLCQACQGDRRGRRRRAVLIGGAAGLVPGTLAMLFGGLFLDAEGMIILGFILFPAGLLIGVLSGMVVRDRSELVRFKEYSAKGGAVAMKLMPSAGAVAFRRALGLVDEPPKTARMKASAGVE
jgi:hypothetical protein